MIEDYQIHEFHKRCIASLKASIEGLSPEELCWQAPGVFDSNYSSIVAVLKHIADAESYWIRELGLEPQLRRKKNEETSADYWQGILDNMENRWKQITNEKPNDTDVVWSINRVSHHALYHHVAIVHYRHQQQPDWRIPDPNKLGSWEWAVDYMGDYVTSA